MPNGARYWVFTLNNYTDDEEQFIRALVSSEDNCIGYLAYGREVGENGTPHLQGHLELTKRQTLRQVKAVLSQRAHLEVRKGTFEDSEEYCSKEGDFHSFGARLSAGQGKRTDLDHLAEAIREGGRKRELAETYGKEFIKYRRGIDQYYDLFACRRFEIFHGPFRWAHTISDNRATIFYGAAGIGKTEYAKHLLPKALFVSHLDDLGGFNEDYEGIIFDDMSFVHLPRTSQIHLVDMENDRSIHIRYKTALIPAHTRKIFLTNEAGGFIFDLNDAAIRRRVEVFHLE